MPQPMLDQILKNIVTGGVVTEVMTLFDAAALGLIKGVETDHKFGDNAIVTTKATVWDVGGLYEYPDDGNFGVAKVLKVSSSSVADVMTSGAGAWTVELGGLDVDRNPLSETVELNGQTAVNTVGEFLRLHRMEVMSSNGGVDAVGDIYAGDGTVTLGVPATKYAKIAIGNNQTLMALRSVPAGHLLVIPRWYCNVGQGKEAVVDAVARNTNLGVDCSAFKLKQRRRIYQSSIPMPQVVPFVFPEGWDLEIRATCQSSTGVAAGFDYMLINLSEIGSAE